MAKGSLPAKGTMQGKKLTEVHREAIVQTYAMCHNKEETGRICGVSAKTVRAVLAERPSREVQEARARAAVDLAERVQEKAVTAIDSITPEKMQDASASQLAVVSGILIDKLPVLERFRSELMAESGNNGSGMPLPDDVRALINGVSAKIKSIDVLRVELRDPEIEKQLQEARELLRNAQEEADSKPEAIEAEYEVLDLDNPGMD